MGPGRAARGAYAALLVARRRLAAWHRGPYLPAWGLLARGGLPPADVAAALRGTARADTLLDAATYGSRWVLFSPAPALDPQPGSPAPCDLGPAALTLGLVGGSSHWQLAGPARVVSGPGRLGATAAGNDRQI
jgi:hypothetical protein